MIKEPTFTDVRYDGLNSAERLRQSERDKLLYKQVMALKELQQSNNTYVPTKPAYREPNIVMTLQFDKDGNIIDNTLDDLYDELDELKETKKDLEQQLKITPASYTFLGVLSIIIGVIYFKYFLQITVITFSVLYLINYLRKRYLQYNLESIKDKIRELKKDIKEYEKDSK